MIEVIHAAGISDLPWGFGVMTVMPHIGPSPWFSSGKRKRSEPELILGFTDQDKEGTTQPHRDALVVTLQIAGYDALVNFIVVHASWPDLGCMTSKLCHPLYTRK